METGYKSAVSSVPRGEKVMGYDTSFEGQFNVTPPLQEDHRAFLDKFNKTRRMKRKVHPRYGVDGEFFVNGGGFMGQGQDGTIVDYNTPPATQPGLWCNWTPNEDGTAIVWDQGEKFYDFEKWIVYLVESLLKPNGYSLSGQVSWQGEDDDDSGVMVMDDNKLTIIETGKGEIPPPEKIEDLGRQYSAGLLYSGKNND